jgi:hypothetical protein
MKEKNDVALVTRWNNIRDICISVKQLCSTLRKIEFCKSEAIGNN